MVRGSRSPSPKSFFQDFLGRRPWETFFRLSGFRAQRAREIRVARQGVPARGSAERIWGDFFNLAQRILRKLSANFSASFDGGFYPRIFWPCFSGPSGPPQNSRPNLSAFLSNFTFSNPIIFKRQFSAYGGDQH